MAELEAVSERLDDRRRVLVVDDDPSITELVTAVLTDEGYEVSGLDLGDHASIAEAVGRFEPDCILLDSADGPEFGGSWHEAAYLSQRARSVPTVMFTAGGDAVREAHAGTSARATAANFAAVLPKPFRLDELLDVVATAAGRSKPFDRSEKGERQRTKRLVAQLAERGATDIDASTRREWATFVVPADQCLRQLYWWQRQCRYIVG
ncbi:MAG TPA: response regulator, partial [Candidatus Limnocylindrales bacterium]|nr:response regulator [Candidatus Limnocylindrales bacterium]